MNKAEIKFLCQQYRLKPSKSKGQNFLIDSSVLPKMAQAAGLTKKDHVLEIGPGFGILTEQLIKESQKVLCVELDKNLFQFINQKFQDQSKIEIINADILKIKNQDLVEKLNSQEYKVIANLPYNISKPVLRKFLSYEPKPELMVLMLQKEVAEKIIGRFGKMSVLSMSVKFYAQAEIVCPVAKNSFYPEPAVDSAVVKIVLRKKLPDEFLKILSPQEIKNFDEKKFWQLVKIGFSSPRKQLHNNLSAGYKLNPTEMKNLLIKAKIKPEERAENLNMTDWALLYQQLVVY